MHTPFRVDQVVDITIGNRTDNKVFRAQVVRVDNSDLVLHVPGFDPLHFVDLLKGTDVVLGIQENSERYVLTTRMIRHFKNTSPYLVVRSPAKSKPIRREAVAMIHQMLDIEYIPGDGSIVRASESSEGNFPGKIVLNDVPEPFDLGTPLKLSFRGTGGRRVPLHGRVAGISRDSSAKALYQVVVALDRPDESQMPALLDIIFGEAESRSKIEPLEPKEGSGL